MGWFFKSTGLERVMEINQEMIDEHQAELDKLSGVDTVESEARRKELEAQERQASRQAQSFRTAGRRTLQDVATRAVQSVTSTEPPSTSRGGTPWGAAQVTSASSQAISWATSMSG